MGRPGYRDLAADRMGKHKGKPCLWCKRPIGNDSYSDGDGRAWCSKLCSMADEGLLSADNPIRTDPERQRRAGYWPPYVVPLERAR